MSASARAGVVTAASTRTALAPLAAILFAGLVLRLLLVGSDGFHNDVQSFESWTLTLRDNAPWAFYAKTNFADYPPGYLIVLWALARLYALIPGASADPMHGYAILHALVKLPAIVMDTVDAGVIYLIARRFARPGVALLAAALFALNPAAIYVSAYWGQVDSVSWGLVLVALLLVLRADDQPRATLPNVACAWLAFGASLLLKPQAATIGLLFVAYPFATADAAVRARRLAATAAGIGAALALALCVGLLFHPSGDVIRWLLGRYAFGSGVYPFNSVNAFNLYAVRQPFWQPDGEPLVLFGVRAGSLALWGVVLVLAASALVVGRYVQRKDGRALLEGALLCALAFFILATRMHERYVFGAFALALPLVAFGRGWTWPALLLTLTTYLNLAYSFAYQTAMAAAVPGADVTNLWPAISHPAALANVGLFFWLGYRYLATDDLVAAAGSATTAAVPWAHALAGATAKARAWFDPREGVVSMTRLDYLLAAAFTLGAFVLCAVALSFPHEKYFDEIYYARAGEEYIKHKDVSGWGPFEFTHPPLTKLLITSSMLLFGGLHGVGDTGIGWRFLNVVVGALMVGLIYAFAKRLTSSTLFASLAGGMLALDGFRYAQSRIATPEITVAFLSLLTLYTFYRLWLATQVARRTDPLENRASTAIAATMALGVAVAVVAWLVAPKLGPIVRGGDYTGAARTVLAMWTLALFWLVARVAVAPRFARERITSYADGTRVFHDATQPDGVITIVTPDGERLAPAGNRKQQLMHAESDGLHRTIDADGTMVYATPAAAATYRPNATWTVTTTPPPNGGTAATASGVVERARSARGWWFALAISSALLADAKWNGLFDFVVVWAIAAGVAAQRWLRGPAVAGNPFGAPLDIVAASMLVAGGIVYVLSYIPYFTLGHGFVDMVAMQQDMYRYHSTLVATHPYASVWWQWPLLDKPVLYYAAYTHSAAAGQADCCVSAIRALPNPLVWWSGLVSIPFVGWLAWSERNKGYTLLIVAYLFQWLPWIRSPRLAFEYHFLPNLALIVLANAIVLQRLSAYARERDLAWGRWAVGGYAVLVVAAFVYFFPVVSGWPMTYGSWMAHMWNPHWV